MLQDISKFIFSCSVSAQAKIPRTLPVGKLMPLRMPQGPYLADDY